MKQDTKSKKMSMMSFCFVASVISILLITSSLIKTHEKYTNEIASHSNNNSSNINNYSGNYQIIDNDIIQLEFLVENVKDNSIINYHTDSRMQLMDFEQTLKMIMVSKKGDSFFFGTYEQDNNLINGKEPIKWTVLKADSEGVLLLSDYNIDCVKFNNNWDNVSWKNSTLRVWLNNQFFESAFSDEEKSVIKSNTIMDITVPYITEDKVYILSSEEWNLFGLSGGTKNTEYSIAQGIYNESGFGWTWLRTKGIDNDHMQEVDCTGAINTYGSFVDCNNDGVRPVICIKRS